jgi:recombination protein RecR
MVSNNTKEIDDLIKVISKLPGLGPKSAKRIVLKLINNREELIKPLTNTLAQVYKNVVRCKVCGNLKSINANCLCSNKNYDQICVVENIADMWVIESTGIFKGHYHILGGTLPSFEIKNTDNGLLIESLVNRVKKDSIKEVILATSATVEGQTTAHYIQDSLKNTKVKISKLAQGLPVGGEIEFLDDGTLFSAFKNRGPVVSD